MANVDCPSLKHAARKVEWLDSTPWVWYAVWYLFFPTHCIQSAKSDTSTCNSVVDLFIDGYCPWQSTAKARWTYWHCKLFTTNCDGGPCVRYIKSGWYITSFFFVLIVMPKSLLAAGNRSNLPCIRLRLGTCIKCTIICKGKIIDDISSCLGFYLQSPEIEEHPMKQLPKDNSNITITEGICQHGWEHYAE